MIELKSRKRASAVYVALLAMVTATLVSLGIAPASAHTGDLKATYACQPDGTYLATYTLNLTQSELASDTMWRIGTTTFQGTPGNADGMDKGPIKRTGSGTFTLGTQTLPGNTTVPPWVYAFTTWSDNFTKGSDGRLDKIAGDCKPALPNVIETSNTVQCGKVTVTLRNRSPWVYPVSVSKDGSTPNAKGPLYGPTVDNRTDTNGDGVLDLNGPQKDVTKSATYTFAEDSDGGTATLKYVVAAGSEQDLYLGKPVGTVTTLSVNTNCLPDKVAVPAEPSVTDPCGPDNATWNIPANTASVVWTLVDGELIASTTKGYVFNDGTTKHNYGKAKDTNKPCPVPVAVPAAPAVVDLCGPNNAAYVATEDTETLDYTFNDDGSVTVTPIAPAVFEGDSQSVTFPAPVDSNEPCPVDTPPVVTPPVVTPPVVTPPVVVTPVVVTPVESPAILGASAKIKPKVGLDTRCTGTTTFTLDNRRSNVGVPFKLKVKQYGKVIWTKTIRVGADKERTFTKRFPNGATAIVTASRARAAEKVPATCPVSPGQAPSTGR